MRKMTSLTLSIPKEVRKEMDEFPEINWSEVARQAINTMLERLELLKRMDRMLKNSKLTEKDALELGRKVNRNVAKRYLKIASG